MAEVHAGCCGYYSTAEPPYLDSRYWNKVGSGVDFVPKSPLPAGTDASDAIGAIIAPGAKTRLECLSMTIAIEYYSLLKGLGAVKFNAMFPGGAGLRISTNSTPLITGVEKKYKIVTVGSAAELLPGDWVYFKNFSDYLTVHPGGYWQGENAAYLGNGKFRGFGLAEKTESELNQELVDQYNMGISDPTARKTVADLLAGGGGLLHTPVVRPDIVRIAP